MKLRIQGSSIRLRLTQPEVAAFVDTGMVQSKTGLGLAYALRQTKGTHPIATFEQGTLTVWVPESLATQWTTTDQVGFEATQPFADGTSLSLLVEKDFQCLHRDGENKAELYPHPDADNGGSA